MITREEVEYTCDLIDASDGPTPSLATIRAYVAQEPARDAAGQAAVAWAEADIAFTDAIMAGIDCVHGVTTHTGTGGLKLDDIADSARRAYLALRAARPTETEGAK
jgi:hypothetical protein